MTTFKFYLNSLKGYDWVIISIISIFFIISLLTLYSTSLGNNASYIWQQFYKQIFFILIGTLIMFLISIINYHSLKAYALLLYLIGIWLLIAVLFLGRPVRGSVSWFLIYGFGIQPVEFVKIIFIIVLASYFSKYSLYINRWICLLGSFALVFIPILLVLKEPDFGSAAILFLIWLSMLFFSDIKKWRVLILILLIILACVFLWFFVFKTYQKERIINVFKPSHDISGSGYHLRQSLIAIGSGEIFGRGFIDSTQSQLRFLPEVTNDFIFANIAEKIGFLGTSAILFFCGILGLRIIKIMRMVRDDFGYFLVFGIFVLFFVEIFINIAMNIGFMPIVGISFPFLSYGGSSLISSMIVIGILQSVIKQNRATIK